MINSQMRTYNYFLKGGKDSLGFPMVSEEPQGTVKMAININNQYMTDNILYSGCSYVGLTYDSEINDSYSIEYGEEMLNVKYVNPQGRLRQVFLEKM